MTCINAAPRKVFSLHGSATKLIDNHSHSRSQYCAMIVCICKAVSDRQIRAAVKGGATRLTDLRRQTGLGTCCGKCLPEARRTLADSLSRQDDQGSRQEAC